MIHHLLYWIGISVGIPALAWVGGLAILRLGRTIQLPHRTSDSIVLTGSLVFCLWFTIQPLLAYASFNLSWYDMGFMLHPLWNTTHGHILEFMRLDGVPSSILGDHFSPVFLLIAPLFFIAPYAGTLFAVQAGALVLAAIILYVYARDRLGAVPACALFLAMLLYAPMQHAPIHGFHTDTLTVPLIAGMILAAERKKLGWFVVCWTLTLTCKEHLGLILAPYCGVLAIRRAAWRIPMLMLTVLGCAATIIIQTVVIPGVNNGHETAALAMVYPGGEKGIAGVVAWAVAHPLVLLGQLATLRNFEQIVWIFGPWLFLPFVHWGALVALSLMLLKEAAGVFTIDNHHCAYMMPLLVWGVVETLNKIPLGVRKQVVIAIVFASFGYGFLSGESPLSHRFWRSLGYRYLVTERSSFVAKTLKRIPENATVSADSHLAIHLFNRRYLYIFPLPETSRSVDFVVIDRYRVEKTTEIVQQVYQDHPRSAILAIADLLAQSGNYRTVLDTAGLMILENAQSEFHFEKRSVAH